MFDFDVRAAGPGGGGAPLEDRGPELTLADVPCAPPVCLAPALPAGLALERMRAAGSDFALVASGGLLLGLVDRPALLAAPAGDTAVWRVMAPCPDPLPSTEALAAAAAKMAASPAGVRPVTNSRGLVTGLVRAADVVARLRDERV
jgi:hypothetical protein